IEDLVHNQQRTVRITFEAPAFRSPLATPSAETPSAVAPDDAGLAQRAGPMTMRVRVIEERIQRPGWRIGAASIRLSSRALDPELARRQMQPQYEVALSEDRVLGARIAA